MSEFEEKVQQQKAVGRKRRQHALFEAIADMKAGIPYGDLFWLFQFFAKEDPTEQDLMNATRIVEVYVASDEAFSKTMREFLDRDRE